MDAQPFPYYPSPQQFDSYSSSQYPPEPFDREFAPADGPFVEHNYIGGPVQDGTQGWSAPFPAPQSVPFQQPSGVPNDTSENSRPAVGGSEIRAGRLRLDVNFGNKASEEAAANLASPLDLRSQHSDSAVTSAVYPTSANAYSTPSNSPTCDMNRDRVSNGLSLPLTMPHDSSYFMSMYPSQQVSHPQPGSAVYRGPRQQAIPHHHRQQQYATSRSPQPHLHPSSAVPYGSSTPRIGLSIPPYTPSSIASSSARSVSPASTAATSAQPLDFSSLASPSGDQEFGIAPGHSPTIRSSAMVPGSLPFPLDSAGHPERPSANGHSVSPIRRRAGKQRLDDARRKEICTYARDRPKARQEDIALKYGVERSTISKILKNKDKWLSVDTHTRKPIPVKHRPSKFPEIEAELLKWVKECQENDIAITDNRIKTKARECAAEIGLPEGKFKASSGWIENFKVRNNLTKRSQDEQGASTVDEEQNDADHMDEDDDVPIPASQATRIEDGSGYEVDQHGDDSFNSYTSLSTQADSLAPPETSFSTFSTFSTDSAASASQNLSLFVSGTPMSSNPSSFASSPSAAMSHHAPADAGMRPRGHSHTVALRAMGSSCTPSGSPQPGGSSVQPVSPVRLDMRLTNTPTSASMPRFPSPLSASTSASANPLVLAHNPRHTPISQTHSRQPSDASGFSYDAPSHRSTDMSSGFSSMFQAPTAKQALDALDTVITFLSQPLAAEIASQPDRMTFDAVRVRLAERMMQAHQQRLHLNAPNNVHNNQ